MENYFSVGWIRRCQRALEREVEIEVFEEWQHRSDPVDPRILEKLTRALQEAR